MATTEDQKRDINYFRTLPDMGRQDGSGGESGSLNVPDMIERIKRPIMDAEEGREYGKC